MRGEQFGQSCKVRVLEPGHTHWVKCLKTLTSHFQPIRDQIEVTRHTDTHRDKDLDILTTAAFCADMEKIIMSVHFVFDLSNIFSMKQLDNQHHVVVWFFKHPVCSENKRQINFSASPLCPISVNIQISLEPLAVRQVYRNKCWWPKKSENGHKKHHFLSPANRSIISHETGGNGQLCPLQPEADIQIKKVRDFMSSNFEFTDTQLFLGRSWLYPAWGVLEQHFFLHFLRGYSGNKFEMSILILFKGTIHQYPSKRQQARYSGRKLRSAC